jgi:hypothetical protein
MDAMKPKHYLISVDAPPLRLHAYLMTTDKDAPALVAARMEAKAHELGLTLWPGVFLQTHLSTGVNLVREIFAEGNESVSKRLKTAKDFHLTILGMRPDSLNDKRLMELH